MFNRKNDSRYRVLDVKDERTPHWRVWLSYCHEIISIKIPRNLNGASFI